jgi:hypothetical protein
VTHVLRAGKREDLDGEGGHKVGRKVDEVDLPPVGHALERVEIDRNHDHNEVRYKKCDASASSYQTRRGRPTDRK